MFDNIQFLAEQIDTRNAFEQKGWKTGGIEKLPFEYQMATKQLVSELEKLDPAAMRERIEKQRRGADVQRQLVWALQSDVSRNPPVGKGL